ncbi:Bfr1p [Sugiyamaella lignohabitans]|uniref:Bfr1p n=1 Tax=Sugiyamaella lignohabitans TaxID=796027 RepID=A0A167ESP2_9ASCO|nr:Bfr1p [Sugiyamaella lignohabitans]ANB14411.1 Bfr1p [Sugiyamaella lignohabitans]
MSKSNSPTPAPAAGAGKRVTRPNKEAFNAKLAELEAEFKTAEKNLEIARNDVKKALGTSTPQTEEREKLSNELNEIAAKQRQFKTSNASIKKEIDIIDENIKRSIKDLKALKDKNSYKSVDEVNAKIKSLERDIESGKLRLVEEKRYIADISNLKKIKNSFGQLDQLQASIDAERAKLAKVRGTLDTTSQNALSDRYNEVKKQLDAIRDGQQKAYKEKNTLFEKRDAANKVRDAARSNISKLKDEYYGQLRAYTAQAEADRIARAEKEEAEKKAFAAEKKKAELREKLEAASEPAFANQIDIAENLLVHFDPEYKRADSNDISLKSTGPVKTASGRTIDVPHGAELKKSDEELFAGLGGKKNKKKSSSDSKLRLNVGIIDDFATLNIPIPVSKDDVEGTIAKLKEKIQYYKENQDRVTAERIERAKAEIAKLELADKEDEEKKEEEEEKAEEAPAATEKAEPEASVEASA